MKYYFIAGEASGDMHGANLMLALQNLDPEAQFRCWGGDRMQAAGGEIVKHIRDLAYMGFWEVVRHLPIILGNISFCKKDIAAFAPDVVILIDYPGFNFRLMPFIKSKGITLLYYISPQLWAWKPGRVKQVKQYVDRMYVIFPFEQAFYAQHGVAVEYHGHPLLDELAKYPAPSPDIESMVIALLPGSRRQEITYLLQEYIQIIPEFPEYRFVIAGIRAHGADFYHSLIGDARCEIEWDNTYALLRRSHAAIVTSGTATLETALHHVPQVICYKGSRLSYFIARLLIKGVKYIGIVNLIADRAVVQELIQDALTPHALATELRRILEQDTRTEIMIGYAEVRTRLGEVGASYKVAKSMYDYLRSQ